MAYGAADRRHGGVDNHGGLDVPPATLAYRLRHVWLDEHEHRGYYYGFANEGLWPLCHAVGVPASLPPARLPRRTGRRTRDSPPRSCEAAEHRPALVLVQDYHFALAPRLLRHRLRSSTIVAFWHIPWPDPRRVPDVPVGRESARRPARQRHRRVPDAAGRAHIFCRPSRSILGRTTSIATHSIVMYRGPETRVRAYPVGIEWDNPHRPRRATGRACRTRVARELDLPDSGVRLGVGIDRLDYTKGINEKFLAIERLLEHDPASEDDSCSCRLPSRVANACRPTAAARAEIVDRAERVNARFGRRAYRPIVLLERHHEPAEVYRLYRAADFCYVSSLRDGMNLVAKEFVAARDDLSRRAGAEPGCRSRASAAGCAPRRSMTRSKSRRLRSPARSRCTRSNSRRGWSGCARPWRHSMPTGGPARSSTTRCTDDRSGLTCRAVGGLPLAEMSA